MALNFPTNPTVGQIYRSGSSATYEFTGTFWDVVQTPPYQIISASSAPTALTASNALEAGNVVIMAGSAPTSQISGSLWYNTTEGETYVESSDLGNGLTWQLANSRFKTYVTGSEPTSSKKGDLWYDTSANELLVDKTGRSTWQLILTGSAGYKNITKIATAGYGGTLLIAEGKVFCIKSNDGNFATYYGALAPNSFTTGLRKGISNAYEIPFPSEINGTCIDVGTYGHSAYALFQNGDLYTWGRNSYGALGTGDNTARYYPTQVQTNVLEVYNTIGENDPNDTRILIKKTDGKVYGCGYNGNGELGLGSTANVFSFTELTWIGTNPQSVWNLGSTNGNIFAQLANGQIWASGGNNNGQLGVNSTTTSQFAQQVSLWFGQVGGTNKRILQMYAGHRSMTSGDDYSFTNWMLLRNQNTGVTEFFGAGYNAYGQLGTNNTTNSLVPIAPTTTLSGIDVTTGIRKIAIQGGAVASVYLIKEDGTFFEWGYNGNGQLGTSIDTTNRLRPIQLGGIFANTLDIVSQPNGIFSFPFEISSPLVRSSTDGSYYATGYNGQGNLGIGSASTTVQSWSKVLLPSDAIIKFISIVQTESGGDATIAIDTKNRIWAWGWNVQQIIDGKSTATVYAPIHVVAGALKR